MGATPISVLLLLFLGFFNLFEQITKEMEGLYHGFFSFLILMKEKY
jgi:hypothetical protein